MRHMTPEPSVDDLLDDPILHILLARDGLAVEDVRNFLEEMRRKLGLRRSGEEISSESRNSAHAPRSGRS